MAHRGGGRRGAGLVPSLCPVTAPITFTGAVLDRAPLRRRRPRWLAARRQEPGARALLLSERGVLMDDGRPLYVAPPAAAVFLGLADGVPLFAAEVTDAGSAEGEPTGLREVAGELPAQEAGLVAYAASLLSWHRRHRFCAHCGHATEPGDAGHERFCPACRTHHFPRTDPVVIVRVTDGERLLLGRQRRWPEGRYSLLAGYVEPGETLEDAVRREVREESQVDVHDVEYLASQPWPFPSSLMIGFHAAARGGEAHADGEELADVRWFERGELEAAAAGRGPFLLPPAYSIARRLIDAWLVSDPDDPGRRRRSW